MNKREFQALQTRVDKMDHDARSQRVIVHAVSAENARLRTVNAALVTVLVDKALLSRDEINQAAPGIMLP